MSHHKPYLFLVIFTQAVRGLYDSYEVPKFEEGFESVTCASAVKLQNVGSSYRLHSHQVNWGSGSGQQSVTAQASNDDPNSLWQIVTAVGQPFCTQGTVIKCGDIISLKHATTGAYLHSHLHTAPLSKNQEVSGYEAKDTGNNWKVSCAKNSGDFWTRSIHVYFMHIDTGKYLSTSKKQEFNQRNCANCPIQGQLEVSAGVKNSDAKWKVAEGIYFETLPKTSTS
eukprot:gb/GEZN01018192.1/.p1 GENE.gb/GEZN01018192.1/~~gb/GEZN01018192.1/.p1  ORF type:complete len:225 (+),score=13.08 gb/GEZN01018192.1/:29-703(+)